MSAVNLRELVENVRVVPLTVAQYHQMIDAGILEEGVPIELLDGLLVQKDRSKVGEDAMTVGLGHTAAVEQLVLLNRRLWPLGCHLRAQQPIALPPDDEPEPDGMILRGTSKDFAKRKPVAADAVCVIEVSDSSLNRDRTTKQRIYADGGVARYWIVNLIDKTVEDYREPVKGKGKFGQMQILRAGEQLTLSLGSGEDFVVAVSELLP